MILMPKIHSDPMIPSKVSAQQSGQGFWVALGLIAYCWLRGRGLEGELPLSEPWRITNPVKLLAQCLQAWKRKDEYWQTMDSYLGYFEENNHYSWYSGLPFHQFSIRCFHYTCKFIPDVEIFSWDLLKPRADLRQFKYSSDWSWEIECVL